MSSNLLPKPDSSCGLLLVLVVLAFVGRALLRSTGKTAALEPATYRWVAALGAAAGVLAFLAGWIGNREDVGTGLMTGLVSGLAAGLALAFVLPLVAFVWMHVVASPFQFLGRSWGRAAERRRERASQQRLEEQRRRQQEEYDRAAPQREQAARERAAAQKRREDARAQCELLYSLHAPDIGQRFPRPLFDDFLKKYMGDERMPVDVEQRGQQLQAIIHQHLQKAGKATKKMTLAELAQWFLREKQQIDASPLGPDDKQLLLSQLEERFAKLQEKYIRGIEP